MHLLYPGLQNILILITKFESNVKKMVPIGLRSSSFPWWKKNNTYYFKIRNIDYNFLETNEFITNKNKEI